MRTKDILCSIRTYCHIDRHETEYILCSIKTKTEYKEVDFLGNFRNSDLMGDCGSFLNFSLKNSEIIGDYFLTRFYKHFINIL